MVEDFQSGREVGLAIDGIRESIKGVRDQLSQLKWVLGVAAAMISVALGGLYNSTSNSAATVGEIKGRLDGYDKRFQIIDKRFDSIDARLDKITALLQPPQQKGELEKLPGFPTPTAFPDWEGVQLADPSKIPADWRTNVNPKGVWIYSDNPKWIGEIKSKIEK